MSQLLGQAALLFILGLSASTVYSADTPRYCPDFCDCSLKNERNYADCRARRLISPSLELPIVVEVLDLSYNDISTLDQTCFASYIYLHSLILAHNSINSIHLDAFIALENLYSLDLSYNRLEYLDERLIEANKGLQVLNLEGNKLMSLPSQPLLRSTSLIHLNLKNAQINFLNLEVFKALPELRRLDLSHNLLLSFRAAAFNALRQLKALDLEENPLNCDRKLQMELAVLQRRRIHVSVQDCSPYSPDNEQMDSHSKSERLEIVDSKEEQQPEKPLLANVWHTPDPRPLPTQEIPERQGRPKYFSSDEDLEREALLALSSKTPCNATPRLLCLKYQQCLTAVSHFMAQRDQQKDEVGVSKCFSVQDMQLAFIVGATGSFFVVIVVATFLFFCRKLCKTSKPTPDLVPVEPPTASAPLMVHLPARSVPPPVPPRARPTRRPRRRPTTPSDTTVATSEFYFTSPHNDNNFISRLFGRPARHQYYRTINQNAVTLIRSLSRTNLFVGRNNPERESSDRYQASVPSRPASNFYMEVASQSEPSTPAPGTTGQNIQARPETPPPKYGDIVASNGVRA